jgi:hypothetical protein
MNSWREAVPDPSRCQARTGRANRKGPLVEQPLARDDRWRCDWRRDRCRSSGDHIELRFTRRGRPLAPIGPPRGVPVRHRAAG